MGYEIIVRNRGRRESFCLFALAGLFGLVPVVTFLNTPKATFAALILGVVLGVPLLVLSFWRLFRMEALALSNDGKILMLLTRRVKGTEKVEIATSDVKSIGLVGHELVIWTKACRSLQLEVELANYAQPALMDLAKRIGVPYASLPFDD